MEKVMRPSDMQPNSEKSCKEDEPESICEVKSSAVVKCQVAETPAHFSKLTTKTDLNQPPANWLRSSAKVPRRYLPCSSRKAFSSFSMANSFPDCIGEVDVVSDAENIKKLLKIPFSKTHVSMMVHRVGKTLLLDEFDVHSHLLRASQQQWEWLKKFYYEHVVESLQENDKCLRKNKSRYHLQNKNMLSKFLHYSTMEPTGVNEEEEELDTEREDEEEEERILERPKVSSPVRSFLSNDLQESHSKPHEDTGQEFLRSVLWTFEDIRMLIGSDLPIFGGGTHPVVTLRLRDVQKPINVLTGLDYWLDNLMCNVPDVFMCYHLNGIVQQYELIKTEDIPQLKGSHFSPKVVKDVAQNILSFLKAKATKSGHTYWLFRGKNEDVVKLYDLTTLCEDADAEHNPFILPVAMLLYRVAKNMKEGAYSRSNVKEENHLGKERPSARNKATIHKLLLNCLTLLNPKEQPQIVVSVHSLLTDLYLPDHLDPCNISSQSTITDTSEESNKEGLESESSPSCSETEDEEMEEEDISCLEVRTLCVPCKYQMPRNVGQRVPLGKDWSDRCRSARSHVMKGLDCLRSSLPVSKTAEKKAEEEVTHFGSRAESIPLPFEPLERRRDSMEVEQLSQAVEPSSNQWQSSHRARLLFKGSQAYAGLAELSLSKGHLGSALRKVRLAFILYDHSNYASGDKSASHMFLLPCLLSIAGDCHTLLCKDAACHATQEKHFRQPSQMDTQILKHCIRKDVKSEYKWCWKWPPEGMENQLRLSYRCYKSAMSVLNPSQGSMEKNRKNMDQRRWKRLTTRGANICNELGVHFMNAAMKIWANEGGIGSVSASNNTELSSLLKKSQEYFLNGLSGFQDLGDRLNQALLYSNLARLARLEASLAVPFDAESRQRNEFSITETRKHREAVSHYRQALSLLEGQNQPHLEENVKWDLCSSLFGAACLLQDYAPLSRCAQEKVEDDVCEWLKGALELCEACPPSSLQHPLYQYRMAGVLHRMASLHHHAYRNQVLDEKRRKVQKELADDFYARSANIFKELGHCKEFLRVLLERIALWEHVIAARQTGFNSRVKSLLSVLTHITSASSLAEQFNKILSSPEAKTEGFQARLKEVSSEALGQNYSESEETERLLLLLQQRMTCTLDSLIKTYSSKASKYSGALVTWKKVRDSLTSAGGQSSDRQLCSKQLFECLHLVQQALSSQL